MSTERDTRQDPDMTLAVCEHPPGRLYSWYARDDSAPGGRVLVVTCTVCRAILQGGADLEEDASDGTPGEA